MERWRVAMTVRAVRAIFALTLILSCGVIGLRPSTLAPAGVALARAAAAPGPAGPVVVNPSGATTFMVVVGRAVVTAAALSPANLAALGKAIHNYDSNGTIVPLPVLVLGSSRTPTVRVALASIQRLGPLVLFLLGMTKSQRLTLITNVVPAGVAVFVNAQPGHLTSARAFDRALSKVTYHVPVSINHAGGNQQPTQLPTTLKLQVPDVSTPAQVDLHQGLPPVRDQGDENSCVGWSTSYYYKTWQEGKEHHWNVAKRAHQFSPSFVYNQIDGGKDHGARIYDAMKLIDQKGDVPLAEFPYRVGKVDQQPSAQVIASAKPYRASTFGYLIRHSVHDSLPYNNDVTQLKRWLASGRPFVIGLPVFKSFMNYTGGVYNGPYRRDKRPLGGHALMVVGYSDDAEGTGIGAFRIVNSWGKSWGEDGFGWLSYDFVGGFVDEAWAMEDALNDPAPSTVTPNPGPGPDQPTTRPATYRSSGKFTATKNPAGKDFEVTVTFEYQAIRAKKVVEDHTYSVKVQLPPNRIQIVSQDYQMSDGAVVTAQVGIVTGSL